MFWSYSSQMMKLLKVSLIIRFWIFVIFPINSLVHCFPADLLFINLPDTVQEHHVHKSIQHIVIKSHVCASAVYIPRINCYVVAL